MSFELIFFTGLVTGLIGGLHCVGMCGPIALSLGYSNPGFLQALIYNFGRAVSYSFMGLIFGFIGNHLALTGLQQSISIVAGILILLIFGMQYIFKNKPWLISHWYRSILQTLKDFVARPKSKWFSFELGVVNAWLPCGLVYLALMTALASGSPWSGAGIMFFFGLGTIPLMLLFMLSGRKVLSIARINYQKFVPYFILMMAVLLILRGLNLGIPYLSPGTNVGVQCH
ncbi:MAG: sulfite exporter TauE/SafE family protein [Saprospiraceae bacterium]|nr:sulfite exporter TauE/SafE family protein [Saprospiraceae bacterium]